MFECEFNIYLSQPKGKEVQLKHTCTCIFMQCQVWFELTNQEALTVLSSIVKHAGSGESMKEVHGET